LGDSCWQYYGSDTADLYEDSPFYNDSKYMFDSNVLFIDTDEKHISKLREEDLICNKDQLLVNENIYTQGNYGGGYNKASIVQENELICFKEEIMERIRKMTETISDLDGFLLNYSVGGGTGSGLGSLILEQLSD
jgi:tubulin alpha